MDRTDYALLEALQEDARASLAELGRKIGLSISATNERVKKLVGAGIVRGWHVRLDPDRLGYPVMAMVAIAIDRPDGGSSIARAVSEIAEVQECHQVNGEWNFLLKVRARDTHHLEDLVSQQIRTIPGVSGTQTTVVVKSTKDGAYIPCLPASEPAVLARA